VTTLLHDQRILVLATADPDPWSAPVYFVFLAGRLYFLSSPRSRHVTAALPARRCAGSIHRDGAGWREIEGLQLDGAIEEIADGPEASRAVAAYLDKFPEVKELVGEEAPDLGAFTARFGAHLYAFVPSRAFLVDNRSGLSGRREIPLP
jgi:uncharacterized protein YhbP (UPF0306 family)